MIVDIPSSVMYSQEPLEQRGSRATVGHKTCATKLPGEGFNLTEDKLSARLGFQWVRWVTTIRFAPCCVSAWLCWLVSHPSIAGDGPELAVCNLAFLQRSRPWVSALFPGRTSLGRELC